jgi:hypothetical protein
MIFRIYKQSVFQGNLKKKNYFEGWYFKHVSQDLQHVFSIIPGISLNESDSHAFIQILNGTTGESEYVRYPLSDFSWKKNKLFLKVGKSCFTDSSITLDVRNSEFAIKGKLDYEHILKYPSSIISPGIMGWYSFVPFMECRHGIVSVSHELNGNLFINGNKVDFTRGKGYIEKDWGTSFPECWIWIQANNFHDHSTSFSFSVAKIPWRGHFFMGFIAFLYYHGRFYMFSTYNNSSIKEISHTGDSVFISIANKTNSLSIKSTKSRTGVLKAPVEGRMSGSIRESLDADVSLVLYDKNDRPVYTDTSRRAGIEVVDKIFEYFT